MSEPLQLFPKGLEGGLMSVPLEVLPKDLEGVVKSAKRTYIITDIRLFGRLSQ